MQKVVIKEMNLEDLDSISNILTSDFDDFWNYNIFKNEILNNQSLYIMAQIGSKIVGFGGIWKAVDDVHITNIVTKKIYRKNGIASSILEKLIEKAKELKMKTITLEVNENNFVAQNLYKKYNFNILGIRKKYYNGIDNAIIMTKVL